MKQALPFHSYNGAEPYLFVSYAHKDAPRVYPLLRALHGQHCRIWYDEGIEIGANWPQTVAERLRDAALVVVFLSEAALASQNCQREIHYSVSQRKELLVVRLDGCEVPAGLGMQLSVAPTVDGRGAEETAAALRAKLDERVFGDGAEADAAPVKKQRKPVNGWFFVTLALSLLLLAAAVGLFGLLNGWFGAAPALRRETVQTEARGEVAVTRFGSELALSLLLRSAEGDCVYLCGDCLVSDAGAIERRDGRWTVGGEAVERGFLADLSALDGLPLTQLALVNESLASLDGVERFPALEYLDLSDNPLEDLAPLAGLSELRVLRITSLPASVSLAPLAGCPALRQVTVSFDMLEGIAPLVEAGVEVVVVK